jgi:hypothetical protein
MKNTTKIISEFFTIGSLTWEEACECALLYASKINDGNMIEEITKIKAKDIRVPITNKTIEEVNQQLSLWN